MAPKFIRCRQVDDHTQIADIAESALQHLPQWEPIPENETAPEPPQPAQEEAAAEQRPEPKPTARKSRNTAASTDKE